jgi:hypothetical protein
VELENVGRSIRGWAGFIDSGCGEDSQVCEVIVFDRVRRSGQPSLTGSMKGMSEKTKIFFDLVTIMIYSLRAVPGLALGICMAAIRYGIARPHAASTDASSFMSLPLVGHFKVTFISKNNY